MKKFFTLMAIALMGLAGCTSDDDAIDYVQDVFIKLENAARPDTRAEEPSKGSSDTDKVTFSSGYIFFITNQGSIKKCYRIAPAGTPTDLPNNVISISEFWGSASGNNGYLFQNVSGEVTQVYIIGNIPDSGNTTVSDIRAQTTLTKLKELTIPVTTQSDIDDVTMEGLASSLINLDPNDTTKKKAEVTLEPLCSRIEIAKITSGGNVTGYKLQGIYVSHFYSELPLNENAVSSKQQLFTTAPGGADYTTYACMCDVATVPADGLGIKAGAATAPDAGNVWAYQFFPGANADRISPRIVIKLNNVAASVGNFATSDNNFYFLNIRGFKAINAGDVDPMSVSRGKIYKIENVAFKENDISDIPNPADISLTVNVSVKNWVVETVEPVM